MDKSDFLAGKFRDHMFRTTPFTAPTVMAVGLLEAEIWLASKVYGAGAYVVSIGEATVGASIHIFKTTAGGTAGAAEPTWTLTEGGSTTDNTVTWVEQGGIIRAGTSVPEVAAANGYLRVNRPPLDANWDANAVGATQNSAAIPFAVATGDYGTGIQSRVVGFFLSGSASQGVYSSLYYVGMFSLANRKDVNINDQFNIPIGNLDVVES